MGAKISEIVLAHCLVWLYYLDLGPKCQPVPLPDRVIGFPESTWFLSPSINKCLVFWVKMPNSPFFFSRPGGKLLAPGRNKTNA